jgi:hypothetical protein
MFLQRVVFNLLYPVVYKIVGWAGATPLMNAAYGYLINVSLKQLIIGFLGTAGSLLTGQQIPALLQGNLLITGLANHGAIPQPLRHFMVVMALGVGIISRLAMFVSWALSIPVIIGILYVITKHISIVNTLLVGTWNNLPDFIQNHIIYVQKYVIDQLSTIHDKAAEPIGKGTLILFILKSITYWGGWSWIGAKWAIINQLPWLIDLVDALRNIPGITWILSLNWTIWINNILWNPLAWVTLKLPFIVDFARWIFVNPNFFLFDWIVKIWRWFF